jgi:hypothetical protein
MKIKVPTVMNMKSPAVSCYVPLFSLAELWTITGRKLPSSWSFRESSIKEAASREEFE